MATSVDAQEQGPANLRPGGSQAQTKRRKAKIRSGSGLAREEPHHRDDCSFADGSHTLGIPKSALEKEQRSLSIMNRSLAHEQSSSNAISDDSEDEVAPEELPSETNQKDEQSDQSIEYDP